VDTEDVKAAKVIRYMWDSIRDATLQAYPWNFAIARTSIAEDASAPEFGWNAQYSLPADCLTPLSVQTEDAIDLDYRIEGGKILTDEESVVYLKYIYRVEDTGVYTALFNEALATRLAYEACEELTQSDAKKQILAAELRNMIDLAYRSDAIEQPRDDLPEDDWLSVRL
jgi:hypothetical protein